MSTTIIVVVIAIIAAIMFITTRMSSGKRNLGAVSQTWLAEDRASESNRV